MERHSLARATAVILGAYLPYVWHGNLGASQDRETREAVARLWKIIHPALETRDLLASHSTDLTQRSRASESMGALNAALEQPTGGNLMTLADILAEIFLGNPGVQSLAEGQMEHGPLWEVARAMQLRTSPDDMAALYEALRRQIMAMNVPQQRQPQPQPQRAQPHQPASLEGSAACQVCGRQDSSVRLVSYPFVVSLFVVTMRRTFVGVWCWPHAALMRALAVVITGSVGWLGIPFGLVYTPLALFKLAQGGDKPADANRELLMAIGEQKLRVGGNPREGIRCLEAALEFGENPRLETLLREQSANQPPQTRDAGWPALLVFPALLLIGSLMGLAVGILDYYLSFLLSGIGDGSGWLITLILWLPLIGGLFVSGLLGSIMLEATLIRTRTHQRLLGIGFAVLAALLMVYASLSGEKTAHTILGFSSGYVTSAPISATLAIGGSLVWGGLDMLYGYVSDGGTTSLFVLGVVLVMSTLISVANVTAALRVTRRQGRVNAILGAGSGGFPMSMVTGWLGMMGCLVVCGVLLAGTYLTSQFQFGEPAAIERFTEGMDLLENGDAEGARALINEARSIDPASTIPYFGLAAIELEHGNCQQGLDTIAIGSAGAPSALQPMVHAFIGAGYECMYRLDDAILSLEKSLELNPNLPEVVVRLSSMYYTTGDYDRSIELLLNAQEQRPEWVTPYAGLAMLYYETGQPEKAEEAIATAKTLPYEDWTDPIMIAGYYSLRNDFATAEKYTREALAEVPGNPNVQASLGGMLSLEGKLDESLEVADDILAGQLHHEDAYLIRSAVFFMKEDLDASLAELEKADEIRPNDPEILSSQAMTYYFMGDYEKASEKARASLSINKYSATGFRALALLYLAQGRDKAALESATRSVELSPMSDLAHYVLGMLAYQRGDEATAVAEFELFLATTWDRPYVREMQAEAQKVLDELSK